MKQLEYCFSQLYCFLQQYTCSHLYTWLERATVVVKLSCPKTRHNDPGTFEIKPLDTESNAPPIVSRIVIKKTHQTFPYWNLILLYSSGDPVSQHMSSTGWLCHEHTRQTYHKTGEKILPYEGWDIGINNVVNCSGLDWLIFHVCRAGLETAKSVAGICQVLSGNLKDPEL